MPRKTKYGLSRAQRLVSAHLFREAFDQGKGYPGRLVVIWERSGADSAGRLGVVTGARTFRKAVHRSRARRLMREAFRLNRDKLRSDRDYVLVGRRGLMDCDRADVEKDLLRLAKANCLLALDQEKQDK